MLELMDFILPSLLQSLVLSMVALGIMIPFKILDFPDLTSEGSYPLGGAISASLIIAGIHPGIAIVMSFLCSGIAGIITAIIHLRLKVNTLLAGILVSTMIYSINLRIMGKPNLPLFELDNLFSAIGSDEAHRIIVLLGVNALVIVPLLLFFYTETGLVVRAVGSNKKFAKRNGINTSFYTILGLFIANGLCGLGGGILVQLQEYMDIALGLGIVVHALAALLIGEVIINPNNITKQILAPFIGAIIYGQIQGFAFALGLAASDLKFLTAIIVLVVLYMKSYNVKGE